MSTEPSNEPIPAPEVLPEATPDATPAEAAATPPAGTEAAAPIDVAAELKALFPALFGGRPKPLKLRIQADIQERAPGRFSKAQLSAFFRRFTGSTSYLIAITQAKSRFDLDGNPAGEISEEHLQAAKDEVARRRNLRQEREAVELQQRRNRAQLLRDFERTTLTEANFCVLKGLTPEELPGLLEIARRERAEAPPEPQRPERPQRPRPEHRDRPPRREGRGEGRPPKPPR